MIKTKDGINTKNFKEYENNKILAVERSVF